jgi:hypothetical protein
MAVQRCPQCSLIYMDAEIEQGVCPGCNAPFGPPPRPPRRGAAPPVRTGGTVPRRAAPFLLGLLVGCLTGPAVLWVALRLGAPLPGGGIEPTAALEAAQAHQAEADQRARDAEAGRQAAESARAEAVTALDAANRKAAALSKQKQDAEQRLRAALAHLAEERGRRAALAKALAEEKRRRPVPTRSFVRDWQLLGPFASTGDRGHDAVYPPEREPVRLGKAYDGFGGRVKWRPYHSPEDKIDLAKFFNYRQAGAAYAVSWVYAEGDQAVTLGVGSDDGVRVWVNREKVHDVKGGRQARPGQDVVKARLKKGWNEIRAKVDNITGTWELYLEFRTADGGRPLKVVSANSPTPAPAR